MSGPGGRKVVVAMSGGVDSSVAASLLHEQGYEVTGLFMRAGIEAPDDKDEDRAGDGPAHRGGSACPERSARRSRRRGCCSAADASDARAVAGMLGIPFFVLNFKDQFDRIIDYFADEYCRGRTPNPCVICNERLKFGRLADYGRAAGADFVATGHHARTDVGDGKYRLRRGSDENKDQSYVLFGLDRDQLARILFPVGGMTKDDVREHARRVGLSICGRPESQDICFAADRDYARVVRERRPEAFVEGPIVDRSGNEVGRHQGIANFTIGQRRGLGVAMGFPVYVAALDPHTNTVTVAARDELASDTLTASGVHWLIDPPTAPVRASVKIRYAHRAAPAVVEATADDRVHVRFDEPQNAVTPGQAAVFYRGDVVLGGGWIDSK